MMNNASKIQAGHLSRNAVVYLRQSSAKQVQENQESARNQRNLSQRLRELGWKKGQVFVVDEDQGQSAKHASSREGFQKLAADVGLRKVGIIMGYEVSRLSRNCADWHRLLELCALFDTLIGDSDGIYNPRNFNDRLLLGLKGTMSEAELHSLRLRLDAGRLSKAKRGELIQHLPTGYLRSRDGVVNFDPDEGVQARLRLVFQLFQELGSAQQVLRYFVRHQLTLPRRQMSGIHAGDILWRKPSSSAILSTLKNPAYAGTFAYGRRIVDPTRQIPGRPATGRPRRPYSEWLVVVHEVYPAFISWSEYERNQQQLAANAQRIQTMFNQRREHRAGTALLSGLVRCGVCGHAMRVAYKEQRFQYQCNSGRKHYGQRNCQFLQGQAIDQIVVEEFFAALQPAQINAWEQVSAKQATRHATLLKQMRQDVQRKEYEAQRAERQYNLVDPEHRLIAASLESKWEQALAECTQAQARLADAESQPAQPQIIPPETREAFTDAGRRLPELWPQLAVETQKSLLRTLVVGVHLKRCAEAQLQIRIVWSGGLVTERLIRIRTHNLRHTELESRIVEQVRELTAANMNSEQIAVHLNQQGLIPCRGQQFTAIVISKLKTRFGIRGQLEQLRRGELSTTAYTTGQLAELLDISVSWIRRSIRDGRIVINRHEVSRCYLFPREPRTLEQMKELIAGRVRTLAFPEVHCHG